MSDYCDALAVVASFLEAANIVSSRVFIDTEPKGYETQSYIVVTGGDGVFKRRTPSEVCRIQLNCYGVGASTGSARSISLSAIEALHGALNSSTGSGVLVSALKSGGGSAIRVPPGVRPFIPVYFSVITKPL